MTNEFWVAIGSISTAVAAYFAWSSKRLSLKNEKRVTEISDKFEGEIKNRTEATRRAPQILLVDDDIFDLEQMTSVLRNFSADVFEARTGSRAIELVKDRIADGRRTTPFDMAIIDMRMPGSDVVDLINEIEQLAPWIGIAVITGRPDGGLIEEMARHRPLTVLIKPLDDSLAEKLLRQNRIQFTRV